MESLKIFMLEAKLINENHMLICYGCYIIKLWIRVYEIDSVGNEGYQMELCIIWYDYDSIIKLTNKNTMIWLL